MAALKNNQLVEPDQRAACHAYSHPIVERRRFGMKRWVLATIFAVVAMGAIAAGVTSANSHSKTVPYSVDR
jgi:hypothetical protein